MPLSSQPLHLVIANIDDADSAQFRSDVDLFLVRVRHTTGEPLEGISVSKYNIRDSENKRLFEINIPIPGTAIEGIKSGMKTIATDYGATFEISGIDAPSATAPTIDPPHRTIS